MDGRDSLGLKRLRRETKKLGNSNERIAKKCENLHFWAFWAKMANFGQFLVKMGKTEIFFQKSAWNIFFSRLQALTNCKVSEKSNERFPRNSVTYERTDVRTYIRTNERDS